MDNGASLVRFMANPKKIRVSVQRRIIVEDLVLKTVFRVKIVIRSTGVVIGRGQDAKIQRALMEALEEADGNDGIDLGLDWAYEHPWGNYGVTIPSVRLSETEMSTKLLEQEKLIIQYKNILDKVSISMSSSIARINKACELALASVEKMPENNKTAAIVSERLQAVISNMWYKLNYAKYDLDALQKEISSLKTVAKK